MNKSEQELVNIISQTLKSSMNEIKKEIGNLNKAILLINDRFESLEDEVGLFMSKSAVIQAKFAEKFDNLEWIVKGEMERLTRSRKMLFEVDAKINKNVYGSILKTASIIIVMLFLYISKSPVGSLGSLLHMLF